MGQMLVPAREWQEPSLAAPLDDIGIGLDRLFGAIELLRERVDPEMPAQMIAVFLAIVANPGLSVTDVVKTIRFEAPNGAGGSAPAVSRLIQTLSDSPVKAGDTRAKRYGLVTHRPSGTDFRVKQIFPTTKGYTLARALADRLGHGTAEPTA